MTAQIATNTIKPTAIAGTSMRAFEELSRGGDEFCGGVVWVGALRTVGALTTAGCGVIGAGDCGTRPNWASRSRIVGRPDGLRLKDCRTASTNAGGSAAKAVSDGSPRPPEGLWSASTRVMPRPQTSPGD